MNSFVECWYYKRKEKDIKIEDFSSDILLLYIKLGVGRNIVSDTCSDLFVIRVFVDGSSREKCSFRYLNVVNAAQKNLTNTSSQISLNNISWFNGRKVCPKTFNM